MLFNSAEFLLFFPLVTALYFLLPHRFRWQLLLLASFIFYMAFIPIYVLILVYLILVDYFAGIAIEASSGLKRKLALAVSLVANISVLLIFKYYGFIKDNLNLLAPSAHWGAALPVLTGIILPIGLSFHTFQAMSYTIEVYRGKQTAERNLGIYALYVMFYPQLVAGPIERPQNLLHQLKEKKDANYDNITSGLKLMLWGFFQKVVIADRLADFVNHIYAAPEAHSSLTLILATYAFAFQIYCDFAGYSDIAIGAAEIMGITLMRNFARPYFATSIQDFWRRWHISLSTWFKDYLYLPLGGSKQGPLRMVWALFVVFLVSGLWHGAAWTFVAWGALHWVYLVAGLLARYLAERLKLLEAFKTHGEPFRALGQFISIAVTFNLVSFAWIFFRSSSWTAALLISRQILTGTGPALLALLQHKWAIAFPDAANFGISRGEAILSTVSILLLLGVHLIQDRMSLRQHPGKFPLPLRWGIYYAAALVVVLFGKFDHEPFIYFQF